MELISAMIIPFGPKIASMEVMDRLNTLMPVNVPLIILKKALKNLEKIAPIPGNLLEENQIVPILAMRHYA